MANKMPYLSTGESVTPDSKWVVAKFTNPDNLDHRIISRHESVIDYLS